MTRRLIPCVLILPFLLSCAGQGAYVVSTAPPAKKRIVLPRTEKGDLPRPYVVRGKRYYPLSDADGFVQYGKASWYGGKFHGRPTASGETFDMYEPSAAHKTLPLGTLVSIKNLSNNKQITVRINDRGPFVKGRVVDLSYAAGREIGLIGPGVADVRIVALAEEVGRRGTGPDALPLVEVKDYVKGEFTIQVGAFEEEENALALASRLDVLYDYTHVTPFTDEAGRIFYRVRVSKSASLSQAFKVAEHLERLGFAGAFVVRM